MSIEEAWAGAVDTSESIVDYVTAFRFIPYVTPLAYWELALGVSVLYLIIIYGLREIMRPRPKFEIRLFSLVHNFNMFAISLLCFLGLIYSVLQVLINAGDIEVLFCDSKNILSRSGPLQFWQYVFWLSKIYELLDTVILCLRKSDLIFLHVYHHWVTNLLCYYTLYYQNVSAWSATTLNALVHIPMYLYYWLSIAGYRDLWFKKYITQMQILQFVLVVSLHTTGFIWHYVWTGNCHSYQLWFVNVIAMGVMVSYLVLFIAFYRKSYTSGEGRRPRNTAKSE
jgi:fatty acid elongase 3